MDKTDPFEAIVAMVAHIALGLHAVYGIPEEEAAELAAASIDAMMGLTGTLVILVREHRG